MTILNMTDKPTPIEQFLYWQCRIRQDSVRKYDGRPTPGMQAPVSLEDGGDPLGQINILIIKAEPQDYTAQFKHAVRKTQDPTDRIKAGLQLLAEAYYQQSKGFSSELLALFALDSGLAKQLLEAQQCVLVFAQDTQHHTLQCKVREIAENEPAHQAIYWHNHMFNPGMPGHVKVLGFLPAL